MYREEESKHILVVEDDSEIRQLLAEYLRAKGMQVTEAGDGSAALMQMKKERYDMILLDMMLPYRSGEDLVRALRSGLAVSGSVQGESGCGKISFDPDAGMNQDTASTQKAAYTPVIVISAKSDLDTRIDMFKTGADDYITKPFDLEEVYVRMQAVLRRSIGGAYVQEENETVLSVGVISYYPDRNEMTCRGTTLRLTAKEQSLLLQFLQNPEKTFTKANLYEAVWQVPYCYEDNTVNVHISKLRKKLQEAAGEELIETVWGIGYRLRRDS